MTLHRERLGFIAAVILYGTIGMFLRYVNLPSEIVAMCRGFIGSGVILLYMMIKKQPPDKAAIKKNAGFLLASGILLGLNWIFLFAAYVETTVAVASLCNYMAPVLVIILAPLILHEKLDWRKLPYVAAAFVGIVLVSGIIGGGLGHPKGVLYGLLAALCFAAIVLCNRGLKDISAFDRAFMQLILSALTILPYVLLKNRGLTLKPDLRSVLIILMLGVLQTGIAYVLYFSGMANLPVQTVAILGYLEPVVSVLCSAVFLHEPLSLFGWIGAALILGAAVLSETERK